MGGAGSGRRRKLTPDDEREVAALYGAPRLSTRDIAQRYGVSQGVIMRVLERAWAEKGRDGHGGTTGTGSGASGQARCPDA